MLIIVPKEIDGLKDIENNLEKIAFNYETDIKNSYQPKIDLTMPKFKIRSDIDLVPHLKEV
jgi:serine protease inhibitor